MSSITQIVEAYQQLLNEEVYKIAKETGAVKRQREHGLDAATFVQSTIFGFWQEPDLRSSGLVQVAQRREVSVTESAISQRYTKESAEMFQSVLQKLAEMTIELEKVDTPLLKQFTAVIVEDSSTVSLPPGLSEVWKGCGGQHCIEHAAVKLFVWWNVLTGVVKGPFLCDGRTSDYESPLQKKELPAGSLYLADLGFFSKKALGTIINGLKEELGREGRRYVVTRLKSSTALYTRSGHRFHLRGVLPAQVGQVRELGVLLYKERLPMRMIMVRVPEEVALERQERIRRAAKRHEHEVSEEALYLANWTIVLTNLPRTRADYAQVLVLLRLRWQIERLFRLWKADGKIDEWRTKKPYRILCEFYAKLCAMIMQSALLAEGCWSDPYRSIVKAAQAIRREVNRIMVAFYEGGLEKTILSVLRCMHSGCRIDHRAAHPSTAQLLADGIDWQLELLLT